MAKLVLTENDLATITNALTGMAEMCREAAHKADPTPDGKFMAAASTQSAEEYEALADKIATAEEIEVVVS